MLFRLILIILIIYIVYHNFIRPFLKGFQKQNIGSSGRKGRINVDHTPQTKNDFKEGEYIDYEEVK